jgi:hypothetical protein
LRERDESCRTVKTDPGDRCFMSAVRAGVAGLGLRGPPTTP